MIALLATGTDGYMGMRVLGIGPVGTLIAQGVMDDQARILVAECSSPPGDSLTASALSEAIRLGLGGSDKVQIVNPEELQTTLETMRLPGGTELTETVARDAAVREIITASDIHGLPQRGDLLNPAVAAAYWPDDEPKDNDPNKILASSWRLDGTKGGQFEVCVRKRLGGGPHLRTLKLLWYVERAKAESHHNYRPTYHSLERVRAALRPSTAHS